MVSSAGLDLILARRLQLGDLGGHLRRALNAFPLREMADRILERYFIPGGKSPNAAFKSKPLYSVRPSRTLLELTIVANFVEVFLAKEGHGGMIGINLLEKIQLPTLPSLFGAMLAGVDYVIVGAGIPRAIPAALDRLAEIAPLELKLDVAGALSGEEFVSPFDPREFCPPGVKSLKRPYFLAIVSSSTLAMTLARKATGRVDGFVVEGKTAGGHNAPPRGGVKLDELGEPVYGERDVPDLSQISELGLPFWLAGSYGEPGKLAEAIALGAHGIQVGTAFAFCDESGIEPDIKAEAIRLSLEHRAKVFTDPWASPTGFPFKVLGMDGTLSDPALYESRKRVCDLGYLREHYRKDDGTLGYRCPGEPVDDYARKGGDPESACSRKCVCNGLLATVGLGQIHKGVRETPLVTAGDNVANIAQFLKPGKTTYSADDVLDRLLYEADAEVASLSG